jgi:hypothetical protein
MNRPATAKPGATLRIALIGAGEVTEHKHLRVLGEVRGAQRGGRSDAARCTRVADTESA